MQLTHSGLQQDDPYHLAIAELLAKGDVLTKLPWAKHTILAERFGDLHFGYHAYLAAFIKLFGAALGGKLGTIMAGAVLLLVVVAIAGRENRWRGVLPMVMLVSSEVFLLRVMGIRPIAFGAAAMLSVIPLATKRRFGVLALVGALFASSYAAFPLLFLPLVAHVIARAMTARELAWRPTVSVLLGVLIGLLLHPNVRTELEVLAVQLFDVSTDRSGHNLEFTPPGFAKLVKDAWLVLVILGVGARYARRAWHDAPKRREELLAWSLLAGLTLLLYVRYERGVDYFVPAAVTFAAIASGRRATRLAPTRAALAAGGLLVVGGGILHASRAWTQSRRFEAIDPRACAVWLERNSEPGDEVFIHDYGTFPRLFYHNRRNVYTLGLDPGFMRAHDPALWRRYLAAARLESDPYPLIAETLGARYVYVEKTPIGRPFYDYLRAHASQFRPVYRDDFAAVFSVVRPISTRAREHSIELGLTGDSEFFVDVRQMPAHRIR